MRDVDLAYLAVEAARHHPGTILTDDPAERDHQ